MRLSVGMESIQTVDGPASAMAASSGSLERALGKGARRDLYARRARLR